MSLSGIPSKIDGGVAGFSFPFAGFFTVGNSVGQCLIHTTGGVLYSSCLSSVKYGIDLIHRRLSAKLLGKPNTRMFFRPTFFKSFFTFNDLLYFALLSG